MLETKLGSSDRNVVVDFLKGLGILLVVMGHCDVGPNVSKLIYSFHMPLFFFLSGIVYKDKICSMKCFFLHKAKGILYPYYVLGFCIILYNTILDLVIRGGTFVFFY